MIDLPGIRVAISGQSDDIGDQIKEMIMKYIRPEDTIILNVVQASVDFTTCESIRLSRLVDKVGQRTLLVVTKVDRSPEQLFERVTSFAATIGLGYSCVRNRTNDEGSYEEARAEERLLFNNHSELKKFPKEMVSIPSLTKQLTEIQAHSIRKALPKLVRKIETDLSGKRKELNNMSSRPLDDSSATNFYLAMVRAMRRSLENLIKKQGFLESLNNDELNFFHCHELFTKFAEEFAGLFKSNEQKIEDMLKKAKGVHLPNFLEYPVFDLLVSEDVDAISEPCFRLVTDVNDYATQVTFAVIDKQTDGYPRLNRLLKEKMQKILVKFKRSCDEFVARELDKEREIVYTYNKDYLEILDQMRMKAMDGDEDHHNSQALPDTGIRDMKVCLDAYRKVGLERRLTDLIPRGLRYALQKAVIEEWEVEVQVTPPQLLELMAEEPQLYQKRCRLLQSIEILDRSYEILQCIKR